MWDGKEREGRATRNRLDELLPGTEPERLLMGSQQQRGLRRTSPPPALAPLVDSPDSGMSNEFIKTSSTQSWKEDEYGRERQGTKQVCARVCGATAPCHPAWRRQVTPLLRDLSWLPITLRLKCKPLSWHSRPFSSWSLRTSSTSVSTPPSVIGQPPFNRLAAHYVKVAGSGGWVILWKICSAWNGLSLPTGVHVLKSRSLL